MLGIQITVLAPNRATGAYEITLQEGDEGAGPPPRSHGWDESFFVTRGAVEFDCGGRTELPTAGTLVHLPAGTVHAFRFGAGGGGMLEFTGAGGRAPQLFTSVARELPPGSPDMPRVVDILHRHGVAVAA